MKKNTIIAVLAMLLLTPFTFASTGDALLETANNLLIDAAAALEAGAEWMAGEIPDVIEQLLVWHAVDSVLSCLLAVAVLVGWLLLDRVGLRLAKQTKEGEVMAVYIIFGTIPRAILVAIIYNTWNLVWLKILVAPKLYLLEYAALLAKGAL